ncbi:FHA domain-containing protein [Trichocoleus sp. FACHB-262]|uniref:FHA domain-containing protein n=1 Tax=Trichocoleus sp. FACHB-262 TaxID=2692869 RepID=UPI001683ECD4|nr:FHA domain-containing protein [Trichocoleus sp. FACHB-262]MBD2122959.1 FHA domain-containing protein [Trichocoleus sp. FACHB-262]
MIDPRSWAAQSLGMMSHFTEAELEQRLGLYRVFLKLYEHHRDLLNEILELENSGKSHPYQVTLQYVQGVVSDDQVHLVTNLIQGNTQALLQPQQLWIIGRDRHAAIPIRDERLSRRHAVIQYVTGQGFYLIDLDSTNGSFINGERIWHCALLKEGDRVRLGSLTFTFFICHSSQTLGPVPPQVLEQLATRCTHDGEAKITKTEPEAKIHSENWEKPLPPEVHETSRFLQSHWSDYEPTEVVTEPIQNPPQPASLLEQLLSQKQKLSDCN